MNPTIPPEQTPIKPWTLAILLLGMVGLFGGQAWLFHRGQTPVMALLQNEDLVAPLVEQQFGIDWNTWVSDSDIHRNILTGLQVTAAFFLLCALCSLALPAIRGDGRRAHLTRNTLSVILLAGMGALAVLAWLSHLDHNEIAFHYLEYSTGVVTPLVGVMLLRGATRPGRWLDWTCRIALAFTFTVHGLYAVGLDIPGSTTMTWTLPGSWVEMTVTGLGRLGAIFGLGSPEESTATGLLFHVGILDLLAAVAVLVPRLPSLKKTALIYMAAWGLLTAVARTWSHFHPEFAGASLAQWIPETMIRLPHFALPVVLLRARFPPVATSPSTTT